MAVYRQSYKRYQGDMTDERWRWAVLARYSFQSVFESKLLVGFYTMCFMPVLIAGALVYVSHSTRGLAEMRLGFEPIPVNNFFFNMVFRIQTFMAFMFVTFAGPALVSSDVANNALPIYLSKPFSRYEYVSGRLSVLLILTSAITWIPCLILVGIQTDMAGIDDWLLANPRIPYALFAGSWIWILTVSLLTLAFSAWLKWRPLATGSLFGVFFAAAGIGTFSNNTLGSPIQWGVLMNLSSTISMIFDWLIDGTPDRGQLPAWAGLLSLALIAAASVYMLYKKIRSSEVVR